MCVCVCVCERERERERESRLSFMKKLQNVSMHAKERKCVSLSICRVCVCVYTGESLCICVCVRLNEGDLKRQKHRKRSNVGLVMVDMSVLPISDVKYTYHGKYKTPNWFSVYVYLCNFEVENSKVEFYVYCTVNA